MNILILQASPRAKGNTAWMAEEYKKAAEAAGHEVTLVNVSKKKIAGCLACEYSDILFHPERSDTGTYPAYVLRQRTS